MPNEGKTVKKETQEQFLGNDSLEGNLQGFPDTKKVEGNGHHRSDAPAHRPCHPDPGGTEDAGKYNGKHYAEDQIGEGSCHEAPHKSHSPQDTVGCKLGGYHKVEGGQDPEELNARCHGSAVWILHKQIQTVAA